MIQHISPFFRLWFLAAAVLLCTALCAFAHPATDSASTTSGTRTPLLLGVFASSVFGVSAPDFAKEYSLISETPFAFDSPLSIGASTKTTIGVFRFGASVEAYRARFQDNYQQDVIILDMFGDTVRGFRAIYQDFNVKVLPVFATAEYVPIQAQFRTYAGAGVGVAYTEVFWSETINRSNSADIRAGGVHTSEKRFAPAFRLYAGIELGFDRVEGTSLLHSLFIEARYTHIAVSLPLLERISPQVKNAPPSWRDEFSVRAGGFALTAGIALQFHR